ncbi:vacuolar membrane protein [Kwoniella heveanensis BCC8398]|uniref:E3 ubiquitin-protein ligase PEP5 n=1 Tax=Kwoniella heveanensis BCC8398 TaxID=1296120 RepID=A0A1B9H1Z3_9TREE|nr:vacuolar membrane protein [Kwoniella heveanensis BCC8398]
MASSSSTPAIAGPSAPQWRSFTFFDVDDVKDVDDIAQSPRAIRTLTPPSIITPTSHDSPIPQSLIVSSGTSITILDRHFASERSFRAWETNGRAIALLEAGGLLVGIGEEEGSRWPVLKIWDLTREERRKVNSNAGNAAAAAPAAAANGASSSSSKADGAEKERRPVLVRNVRIQHGQRPHPVSSIAITSNLSHLAIGLGDGTVLLYRHLLQSLTTSPAALTSLPKARVIHESHEPITGLGFREPTLDDPSSPGVSLFIVTTNRVLSAPVSGKGGEARTIDELGCGLGCAIMDWERKEMIIARDEAIYLYGPDGRGACYAYEGPKSSIAIFKHNLIITSPPFYPSASSASATVRHYVSKTAASGDGVTSTDISKVTVFDLQNKLVAYSGTYRDGVRDVFSQWGGIFVYGGNSKITRLSEQSTSAKLDVLYRRNLFTLAISLARSQGIGEAGIADIHRRYGDYLYTKGDFDGAMGQFVKTLGHLQPSYVIRKFLDAQRIHNLTTYLQELHARGLANPDHTTLLLNCYTKTSDRARLDSFIKTEARRSDSGTGDEELPFDLDTAIRVCRQAGFYEHATYLAKKFGRHEEYLRIQIEDAEEVGEALRYVRTLGPEACEANMVRYGRTLLNAEPEATTALLIDLCSGDLGKKRVTTPMLEGKQDGNGPTVPSSGGPAMLSYLGYNRVTGLFTGDTPQAGPSNAASTVPTDKDQQPNGHRSDTRNGTNPDASAVPAQEDGQTYIPPSPRQFFAHFVDHRDLFIRFLESVASNLWDQSVSSSPSSASTAVPNRGIDAPPPIDPVSIDQRAVWNTLLELYLSTTTDSGSNDKTLPPKEPDDVSKAAKEKALGVISSHNIPYDPMHALILCSTFGFTEGMIRLWESMGMYEDILRYWIDQPVDNDASSTSTAPSPSHQVLSHLELYGPTNPHLYPLVLRYLTSSPAILSRHPRELGKILNVIDEERIMPPLAVVQLLSRNGVASVGNVKEWLRGKVEEDKEQVESDKHLVESYRSETSTKKKAIQDLSNVEQPEVFQVTRCAACGGQLDLPSVHFMCKHSYHQR